jgi:Na+-transporting NADH:ubiquinone oxidoreductase subunit C
MKTKIVLLLLVFLGWNCKQNSETKKPKVKDAKQEVQTVAKVSPVIKELAAFADLTLTDSTNVNELILFKEIDTSGSVTEIEMAKAVLLYKKMMKKELVNSLPIFEIKNTKTAILPIQGVGFGGAIWAKVLVDRTTFEIKKIAFEHQAESEGYGNAINQSHFENQFVGTKINLDQNTFTLQKNMERRMDDGTIIDGISGATMTNNAVIEMMNEGMKSYRNYLNP